MYVLFFASVDLLFVAGITCAMELQVETLEIGTLGSIPCDHIEDDPEVRLVQWYKSRSIDTFENGDASLASWADGATASLPNYHMENTTFSLIFDKATLEDEGLYKCSVERGDLFTESHYFTRTVMYALPQMDPEINLEKDLNRLHCTVEHVKPLLYPVFDFDWRPDITETYAVLNEDGTYTTSVCCTLPHDKSASRVECSYSYLHYQGVGSFDLPDITTDSPMEYTTTTVSPTGTSVTCAGDGCTNRHTANIAEEILLGLLTLSNVIVVTMLIMLRRRLNRILKNSNKVKESEQNMIHPALEMGADVTA